MLGMVKSLDVPPHRLTSVEQVHLTLHFIGDTPAGEVEAVMESVRRSTAGIRSFSLTPQRLILLPQRGPKRLIAMETDAPWPLLEMHRRLVHRLASSVRQRNCERFVPHMTLCRFATPTRGVTIEQPAAPDPIPVREIRLMRSVLLPTGAEHREVMRHELDNH